MTDIVTLALPFFVLIGLGLASARMGFVSTAQAGGLTFFVVNIAQPALVFQLVSRAPLAETGDWSFVLTATFATYCVFAIAFTLSALRNGGNIADATVKALLGSQGNLLAFFPALTIAAFGAAAAVPTALILCFDTLLLAVTGPLMMAVGGAGPAPAGSLFGRIAANPPAIAAAIGLVASAGGFQAPGFLGRLLDLAAAAAVPAALFALGLQLATLRRPSRGGLEVPVLLLIKLVAQPAIVYLLLGWVGDFPAIWVAVAATAAAMPPAMAVAGLAHRHRVYERGAEQAIFLGTVVSLVTITALLVLIGTGALPADPFR